VKKISILFLTVLLVVTGCGKADKNSVISDFKSAVNKSKSYELVGTMEIINDEDVFKYDLETKYLYDDDNDYYKVTLVNQTNNHEQIILKNEEGVYVVTPKSTKQSILEIVFLFCINMCFF
jgi:outer membrane lipoprotein-sorting protein